MNPLVKKLEERLLPEFEKVAEKIRQEIPNIRVDVYSCEVGSLTQYQGYSFWLECTFTKNYGETDTVALGVELGHLTTTPKISAGVSWGYPVAESVTSFRNWGGSFPNRGIVVSDEVLEDLYKDLPRLYEALLEALRRRKPANE